MGAGPTPRRGGRAPEVAPSGWFLAAPRGYQSSLKLSGLNGLKKPTLPVSPHLRGCGSVGRGQPTSKELPAQLNTSVSACGPVGCRLLRCLGNDALTPAHCVGFWVLFDRVLSGVLAGPPAARSRACAGSGWWCAPPCPDRCLRSPGSTGSHEGMATLQPPISPWALLSFPEEMPYLKCPLHAVLKLTPIAYGEREDPATETGPPGGPGGAVSSGPALAEADLSPPSPRLPSGIHLPERGVCEHTPGEVGGECELEAPSSPPLCRLSGRDPAAGLAEAVSVGGVCLPPFGSVVLGTALPVLSASVCSCLPVWWLLGFVLRFVSFCASSPISF